ncbi:hypothetical protein AAXB25_14815 [Paenibacillus lautus]|uniref:hypothetical protein n=1 Tax=Paenibacillus lautus TaxID=1401 RepID=UPI003D2964E2
MQNQTQLYFVNHSKEQAQKVGYPTFNNCNHYLVDMSHLDSGTDDYMNTISIKLPNGNFATLCVMQTSKDETCIDAKFHGENIAEHRVYAMGGGEGRDTNVWNKNIYALIAKANEIQE